MVQEATQLGRNGLFGIGFKGPLAFVECLAVNVLHHDVGAFAALSVVLSVDGVDSRDRHVGLLAHRQHVMAFNRLDRPSMLDDKVFSDSHHVLARTVLWAEKCTRFNLFGRRQWRWETFCRRVIRYVVQRWHACE